MKRFIDFLFPHKTFRDNKLRQLIERAKLLGLKDTEERDVSGFSLELIEYNEPGVALESLIENMYEQEIQIDAEFYDSLAEIASIMKMDETEYGYMKEMIR